MNNEELIIKMLGDLAESQAETSKNIADIKDRVINLENGVTNIETRVTSLEVNQETVIIPQIKLLAEGHGTIIEHIKRLDAYPIQEMQDDIVLLKSAVKALLSEVAELKASKR